MSGEAENAHEVEGRALSVEARIAVVADMLAKCYSNGHIQRVLARRWKVTTRTVRGYIARVDRQWRQSIQDREKRAYTRARSMATLEIVINGRLAMPAKKQTPADMFVVIRAIDQINRMDGHHANKRVEVTGAGGGPILATVTAQAVAALGDDDLEALDRLAEKMLLKGKTAATPVGEIIDEKPLPLPATGTR